MTTVVTDILKRRLGMIAEPSHPRLQGLRWQDQQEAPSSRLVASPARLETEQVIEWRHAAEVFLNETQPSAAGALSLSGD